MVNLLEALYLLTALSAAVTGWGVVQLVGSPNDERRPKRMYSVRRRAGVTLLLAVASAALYLAGGTG